MQTFKVGMVVLVLVVSLSIVQADLITVDGDLSDWSQPDVIVGFDPDDPGVSNEFDIKYTSSLWDATAGIVFFSVETWAPLAAPGGGRLIELMIDADNDGTTGGGWNGESGGLEYLIRFDLTTNSPLQYGSSLGLGDNYSFYTWNGAAWQFSASAPAGLNMSRGNAVGGVGVEWAVPGTLIGSPSTFGWTVHLDDNNIAPDDQVNKQFGKAPEPATLALFALGLGGLYLKRRRTS